MKITLDEREEMTSVEEPEDLILVNPSETNEVYCHATDTVWKYDCVLLIWRDTNGN